MEEAAQDKPGWLRRATAGGKNFLRKPLGLALRLVVRKFQYMEDGRALRILTPLRRVAALPQRRRRLANLEMIAGPGRLTIAEKKDIDRRHIQYLARVGLNLMRLPNFTPEEVCRLVTTRGEEHVIKALSGGRGLLLITAHAGTWWHSSGWLAARGHPVCVAVNPTLPTALEKLMLKVARRLNVRVSYVGRGAYAAARESFQRGEIFVTAMDVSIRGERSRWLPFGAAEFPMDPGTAILALRQRVPVLWCSSHHDADGRSCVEYFPPMAVGPGTDFATPDAVLRRWLEMLHEQWLRHPEQWWPLSFCSLRAGNNLKSPPLTHPT